MRAAAFHTCEYTIIIMMLFFCENKRLQYYGGYELEAVGKTNERKCLTVDCIPLPYTFLQLDWWLENHFQSFFSVCFC